MTQEHSYETGPIRPPSEAMSLLIRVSRACPWNRCRFCTSYRGMEFEARTAEEVCSDIDAMAEIASALTEESDRQKTGGRVTNQVMAALQTRGIRPKHAYQVALFLSGGGRSVFLQDADSLQLPADDLEAILRHVYKRFPMVERVTTYVRSMTLFKCGREKLSRVAKAGLTRVHVGLESGSDEVLKKIRKGVLAKHHILGGRAAMESGLELSEYIMPGVAGTELSDTHADETARVLNIINPHFIRLRTFFPLPGSGLEKEIREGKLLPLDEDGIVREIRRLVAGFEGITSTLVSDHNSNLLMEVEGRFPDDRDEILALIDEYLSMPDDKRRVYRIGRRLGYFSQLGDLLSPVAFQSAKSAVEELTRRFGDADKGLLEVMEIRM